jgi:hypothetical protein
MVHSPAAPAACRAAAAETQFAAGRGAMGGKVLGAADAARTCAGTLDAELMRIASRPPALVQTARTLLARSRLVGAGLARRHRLAARGHARVVRALFILRASRWPEHAGGTRLRGCPPC